MAGSRVWRYAFLFVCVIGVLLGVSGEVLLIKSIENFHVALPVFNAMLVQSYWPVCMAFLWGPLVISECRKDGKCYSIPSLRLRGYLILGVLTTISNLLRMVALAWLPASVFVVASSTDITFNTIFSRVFLKKRFSCWHYLAAALATGGMIVVAASNGQDGEYVCDGDTCIDDYAPGLGCSVGAAVLIALNAVVSESLLKAHKAAGPLGAIEAAMFYSIIPMCLTPLVALVTGEIWLWPSILGSIGKYGSVTVFELLCIGALLSKLLGRVCRFQVVRAKGAFFFSIVNALVRLGTAIVAIFVLNESFNWNKGSAIIIVMLALVAYLRGSYLNMQYTGMVRKVRGKPGAADTALLTAGGVDRILDRYDGAGGSGGSERAGGGEGRGGSLQWLIGQRPGAGGYGAGRQALSLGDMLAGFDGHDGEDPVDDEPWGMTTGGIAVTPLATAEQAGDRRERGEGGGSVGHGLVV